MVKLDKIYTKGGDKGKTSLGNGDRVRKNAFRIKAYGEIDEANSTIGIDRVNSFLPADVFSLFFHGPDVRVK